VNRIRRAWRWWLETSVYVGEFQARWFLTVLYFTVLTPFGFALRISYRRRRMPVTAGWLTPPERDVTSVTFMRSQF